MLQSIDKGRSPLSGLDPRLKLLWAVSCSAVGLIFIDFPVLTITLASVILLTILGKVAGPLFEQLRGFWLIVLAIGAIQCLTVGGEAALVILPSSPPYFLGLIVTKEGALSGVLSILRLLILTLPIFAVVATTSTNDLIEAMNWLGLPQKYSLMMALAFNFMPVYLADMRRVMDAMRVRAYEGIERGFLGRIRALSLALIPITMNAIERADVVGRVLEMRGFGSVKRRASFKGWGRSDRLFLAYTILLMAFPIVRFLALFHLHL
ncbi:MAG: energy-coupling factor transporter transmembrane component T [Candidatus Bathyarchaeia archaeon]